jgi:TfoX/Sxy family transcriptional regulator of competence genes
MAYNHEAADRMRHILRRRKGVTERHMFGGIAFLVNGHMCCGLNGDRLMLRLGNAEAARALSEPDASPMDFTGRPLKSMVYIEPAGYASDDDLGAWVDRALRFAKSLPPKK